MAQHRNTRTMSFTVTDDVAEAIISRTAEAERRTGRSNQSAILCEIVRDWIRLTGYEAPKPATKKSRKKI